MCLPTDLYGVELQQSIDLSIFRLVPILVWGRDHVVGLAGPHGHHCEYIDMCLFMESTESTVPIILNNRAKARCGSILGFLGMAVEVSLPKRRSFVACVNGIRYIDTVSSNSVT